jgi:hypothetical protein
MQSTDIRVREAAWAAVVAYLDENLEKAKEDENESVAMGNKRGKPVYFIPPDMMTAMMTRSQAGGAGGGGGGNKGKGSKGSPSNSITTTTVNSQPPASLTSTNTGGIDSTDESSRNPPSAGTRNIMDTADSGVGSRVDIIAPAPTPPPPPPITPPMMDDVAFPMIPKQLRSTGWGCCLDCIKVNYSPSTDVSLIYFILFISLYPSLLLPSHSNQKNGCILLVTGSTEIEILEGC